MRLSAIPFLAAVIVACLSANSIAGVHPLAGTDQRTAVASRDRDAGSVLLAQSAGAEELEDWNRIVESNNPDDFFDFIVKHPESLFRSTAEAQIKRLLREEAGTAAEPRPDTPPAAARQLAPAPLAPASPDPAVRQAAPSQPEPANQAETGPGDAAADKPAAAVPLPETSGAAAEIVALRAETQRELSRLGCYGGAIDGRWDARSSEALRLYARRKGLALPSLDPSKDVLQRLIIESSGFCPTPACIVTEVLRNGQCVQKVCPIGQSLSNDGRCRAGVQQAAPERPRNPDPAAAVTAPAERGGEASAPAEQTSPAAATSRQPQRTRENQPENRAERKKVRPAPAPAPRKQVSDGCPPGAKRARNGYCYFKPLCSAANKGLPGTDQCE